LITLLQRVSEARVVVAEALYRAWSYRSGHPYHRA